MGNYLLTHFLSTYKSHIRCHFTVNECKYEQSLSSYIQDIRTHKNLPTLQTQINWTQIAILDSEVEFTGEENRELQVFSQPPG